MKSWKLLNSEAGGRLAFSAVVVLLFVQAFGSGCPGAGGGTAEAEFDGATDAADSAAGPNAKDADARDVDGADADGADADGADAEPGDIERDQLDGQAVADIGGEPDAAPADASEDADAASDTAIEWTATAAQLPIDLSALPLRRFICRANPTQEPAPPGPDACPPVPDFAAEWWATPRRVFEPSELLNSPDGTTGAYCLYDWQGDPNASRAEQEEGLPTEGPGSQGPLEHPCEGDAPVVVPLSPAVDVPSVTAVSPTLFVAAAQNAGAVDRCDPAEPPWGAAVTVAVVDSVPGDPNNPIGHPRLARSLHGTAMGLLIRDFAGLEDDGKGPTCAAQILQTLALDHWYDSSVPGWAIDRLNGGHVGTLGGLAEATWLALRTWIEVDVSSGVDSKLVINYSVGWVPTPATLPGASMGADAVVLALKGAYTKGALAFAATGNRVAGPDPGKGPMLPAGFEVGPDGVSCPTPGTCAPLARGVAAAESDSQLLSSTRAGAVPRLVAWGHLTIPDPAHLEGAERQTNPYFPTLAGSSVATALASAAAASIWARSPTSSAEDVYEAVVAAGVPFAERKPDYCAAGNTPCLDIVRRLQLCRATRPTPAGVDSDTPCYETPLSPLQAIGSDLAIQSTQSAAYPTKFNLSAPCGPGYLANAMSASPVPLECPERQIIGYENEPMVYPKPGDPGCDTCCIVPVIGKPGFWEVHLVTNPRFDTAIDMPRLVLHSVSTNHYEAYDLGINSLAPGESVRVSDLKFDPKEFDHAWIVSSHISTDGRRAVSVDVLAR